ncbi:MAG: PilX N-terminal domain-containing pilus assembly protein [Halioglobus sp.]
MSTLSAMQSQRGVALVVSLIFLLIITVISVIAATNSKLGLSMASNLQDGYDSFQAAEAGVMAAIATTGTADNKFTGVDELEDVFDEFADDEGPLGHLNDGNSNVTVDVILTKFSDVCPRMEDGSSVELFDCEYYRVDGMHDVAKKATTEVSQGVIRTTVQPN